MMDIKAVWKYEIDPRAEFTTLKMPVGATPLAVDLQHNLVQMWCLCNPAEKVLEERSFILVGTGEGFDAENAKYIGTFQVQGGVFIWHLFEIVIIPESEEQP